MLNDVTVSLTRGDGGGGGRGVGPCALSESFDILNFCSKCYFETHQNYSIFL